MVLRPMIIRRLCFGVLTFCLLLTLTDRTDFAPLADICGENRASQISYKTELFGKKYRLDDNKSLAAYIAALDTQIERSKREAAQGEAHQKDPLHHKVPKNYIEKKLRHTMEETHAVAVELSTACGEQREKLLKDLLIMAGAIRASFIPPLPGDMDVFTALSREGELRHPPVGLGKDGIATNLSGSAADPSQRDPILPSSYWNKPTDIAHLDLFYGFGRSAFPKFDDIVCTYRQSKQSYGIHPGFEVKCEQYGTVKLKFGEEYSQPFAHRIFWALGFNTIPVDCAPTVKVKWDRRIFTEFNTRKDQRLAVNLFGILPIHTTHLQHYADPLSFVSEVIMLDEQGKEVSMKPEPNWKAFKQKLYIHPEGRPETVPNNFNAAFADRIQYLIFKHVNIQTKDDDFGEGETFLGNWDWDGEGNPGIRENRAFVFVSAWLNGFDLRPSNNKLTVSTQKGERVFTHYITDNGACLGRADDSTKMDSELPNAFPWSFTHSARPGDTAIPLDGSFHPVRSNAACKAADIYDARWISLYLSQLTGPQIIEALVASGLPSAQVRLFYNKLVHRRNKALADLGLDFAPIPQMDMSETFDYDPQKEGLVSIMTSQNEKITAPDDGWVVIHGQVLTRAEASKKR